MLIAIMKKLFIFCLCFCCYSCKKELKTITDLQKQSTTAKKTTNYIVKESFQNIISLANLKGSILLFDSKKEVYYSNDFAWAKVGRLPASTYKIPNSIIALESNVVDESTTVFKWNGEARFLKSWEADLTLKQAFQRSCVPCYQEVARKIGVTRMNDYLAKLNYGNIQVNHDNLENFWLQGNAKISQFQQIDFLQRFQQEIVPVSKQTIRTVKNMMILKETENYVLRGKTGWSITEDQHNGWFVGYLETNDNTVFFATNIEPITQEFDQKEFQSNRKAITEKALQNLGFLLEKQ